MSAMLGPWTPLLLTSAILCCLLALCFGRLRMLWLARKLPGPLALPLLGNALDFLCGPEETFRLVCRLFATHGPVVRLWFGPKLVVGVASARDAQFVLTHARVVDRDAHFNAAENGFIDNGLLTATGETARRHRKVMTPAFSFAAVASYVPVFGRKAELLCARLGNVADGRTFNAKLELSLATLDAIYETAIGVNMDYSTSDWARTRDDIDTGMALIFTRLSKPWLQLPWVYALTRDYWTRRKCRQGGFRDFAHALRKHAEQAAHEAATSSMTSSTSAPGARRRQSFLEAALEGGGAKWGGTKSNGGREAIKNGGQFLALTEREVREEVFTMAAAGMDTTAQTMAYALILLGMHPDCQDEVYAEQRVLFGSSLRPATAEDLPKMAALERVVKETLRLFPPATFLPRDIPEDLTLPSGHLLPRGCAVYVFNYSIHRCARNFPQPERFLPSRWTQAHNETAQPSNAQPSSTQPSDAQPSNSQPSNAQPSNSQPSNAYLSNSQPSDAQPSNAQPSTAQPSNAQPVNVQPSDAQPSNAQPSTAQPSNAQPLNAHTSNAQGSYAHASRHAWAYIPFGGGARSCVGQRYAQAQIKATLSRVLREFRVRSTYSMQQLERIEMSVSNISAVGYDLQVSRR